MRTEMDLSNPRSGEPAPLKASALVDTGAITLRIPEHAAVQLGLALPISQLSTASRALGSLYAH